MSPATTWPPSLTEEQLAILTRLATTYALSHGLLYLPVTTTTQPPAPTSAIHAPLSLFPSPFPRRLFDLARRLQRTYNVLYAYIAMDTEFLDRVMGAEVGAGRVDEFTGQLWKAWKENRDNGHPPTLQLGLFRSDYLVHAPEGQEPSLKQVEFNTISSSFGALSQRSAALHRYLLSTTNYFGTSNLLKPENLPPNHTTAGLVAGLAEAHKAYGVPNARILFVVQPGERNVFDQRWLEYELLEKHSIHVIRQTFPELGTTASLSPSRTLLVHPPASPPHEISAIYFRAGYTPTDYASSTTYATRALLDRSRAINCPSIALQLAGGKKVQQVLTRPGVLARFLDTDSERAEELRSSWMGMWGLDDEDVAVAAPSAPAAIASAGEDTQEPEPAGVRRARERAAVLVLKPQREGGGNNVYKGAIPPFLDALPARERAAWIAMELIAPPDAGNYLVRAGSGTEGAVRTEVVSELGIFGWALFGAEDGREKGEVVGEGEAGWLLRTKGKDSDEGGVAAGFSVLDSVLLVD